MTDATNDDAFTDQVRVLLQTVLRQADFPGCDELSRQAQSVKVVGGPMTMIDLRADEHLPPSAFADGPVPLTIGVSGAPRNAIGELLIWVEHGYLSGLEFAWWTDDPPDRLPNLDQIEVRRK